MCFRNGASWKVARRESPLRNKLFFGLVIAGLAIMFIGGCSGGHSSGTPGVAPTPTPTPTPIIPPPVTVTATIAWPARSRAVTSITGTASSLSAVITLVGASTTGGNLTVVANRPSGADTTVTTQSYTLGGGQATPGNLYPLQVSFYTQTGATGNVIATARQSSTLVNADGTLLATVITTSTNIATVKVTDIAVAGSNPPVPLNQTILIGQTADVEYSAYDGGGNLLALPPQIYGSGFVTVGDQTKLTNGAEGDQVKGVAPSAGTTFTVSVDGVTSNPFTVKVTSTATLSVTPNPATVSPGIPTVFTATVTNDPTNAGVTWSIPTGTTGKLTQTSTTATYTAAVTVPPTQLPFTLTATSNYDPNVVVSVPVTISSLVSVVVTPATSTISVDATLPVSATVINDPNALGVTWAATGGSFSSAASTSGTPVTYTAPATPGVYTLTATSVFDKSKIGTATVTVQAGSLPVTVN